MKKQNEQQREWTALENLCYSQILTFIMVCLINFVRWDFDWLSLRLSVVAGLIFFVILELTKGDNND